jgi:hypothetical protein
LRIRLIVVLVVAALPATVPLAAQQKNASQPGSPQNQSQNQSAGGSAPAQGITWPRSAWESLTDIDKQAGFQRVPFKDHPRYLLCYSLDVTTGSLSTPPFVFRQVDQIAGMTQRCINTADAKKPLLARGFLGVAIDARHVPTGRMRSFNLTLTTAAGQPINLYPVRPSAGASSAGSTSAPTTSGGGAGKSLAPTPPPPPTPTWGKIYYLIWPQELGGDVIPTVTVSLAYTPPVPGSPWQLNTVYPEGSIVTPSTKQITTCSDKDDNSGPKLSGHYFVASRGGISASNDENHPRFCVQGIKDGTVLWVDAGTSLPTDAPTAPNSTAQGGAQKSTISTWAKGAPYDYGAVVYSPVTSHYYVATQQTTGTSGNVAPFSPAKTIPDGGDLSWAVFGSNPPPVGDPPPEWSPNPFYHDGQTVYDSATQLYFTAVIAQGTSAKSGPDNPFKKYMTALQYSDPVNAPAGSTAVQWLDVGSTAPVPSQPASMATPTRKISWEYFQGYAIFDPASGHFYTAIRAGRSSDKTNQPLAANRHHSIPDGSPAGYTVKAITEDFLGKQGQTQTGEWMSKADPNTDPECANLDKKKDYPSFSDVSVTYHKSDCIRDANSATIFQLNIPTDESVVPAVPANFGLALNTVLQSTMTYQEDFLDSQKQKRTGKWKPKADPDADPKCANQNENKYPDLSGRATYHNNDCGRDKKSAKIFQLVIPDIASNEPVVPVHPLTLRPYTPAPPSISIPEQFLDQDKQWYDLAWHAVPGTTACSAPDAKNLTYYVGTCVKLPNLPTPLQLNTSLLTGPLTPYPQTADFQNTAVELSVLGGQSIDPIQWEDIGTSVPSLASSGEPADQTVAQAYTLTQVHPKYYFNLSTGLIVSTIHSRSFGWATIAPGIYTPIQVSSNPIVDAGLFLTIYWPRLPMDAESPWNPKNMIPAPTLGMSFSSPTSNFYLGLSSEVRRNVQIVFGASTAEPQRLSSTSVSATNMGTPPTAQKFTMGGFVGLSLNISGFIQTVLGGK